MPQLLSFRWLHLLQANAEKMARERAEAEALAADGVKEGPQASCRTACCSVMPATTDACTTSGPCPTCYVGDCSRPALTRQPGYLQMCPCKLQFFHFLRLCGARHADASSCCCRVVVRGKLQLSCQHLQWLLGRLAQELLLWLPTGPRSPGASSLFPLGGLGTQQAMRLQSCR